MVSHRTRRIDVAMTGRDRDRRMIFRRTEDESASIDWATSDACPAAERQIEALADVEMPRPAIPGIGPQATQIILDGAAYVVEVRSVHADGQAGDLRVTSNVGAPIARWANALSAALEPCWRAEESSAS